MAGSKDDILEKNLVEDDIRTEEPPMYRVILHNDDYTPKLFVVELLIRLFHKSPDEATQLMWKVHEGKKGVVGVYPREIAESKVDRAISLAREYGFPLMFSMEPES